MTPTHHHRTEDAERGVLRGALTLWSASYVLLWLAFTARAALTEERVAEVAAAEMLLGLIARAC